MEEEEKEAQSAKLQELIRRGTPNDLQEANRLMKVMAGFDTRSKTDYRAKAAEEIGKIQAKARLLEERLEAFQPGDKMEEGDVFSELASALQNAQPKIQKMCEEESDDHAAVAKLFEINDSIHRTVERYKLMKSGDMEGAAKVAAGGPAPSQTATVTSNAAGELSLIDFDPEPSAANGSGQAAGSSQAGGLENDLLGLDIGGDSNSSFGQGGGIALGFGANQSESIPIHSLRNACTNLSSDIPGPALLSSLTENSTAKTSSPTPSNSHFPSFGSAPGSQSITPQPQSQTPLSQSAFAPPPSTTAASSSSDPFALLGMSKPTSQPQPPAPTVSNDDDEWNFSSALPEDASKPRQHKATVSSSSVRIDFVATRVPGSNGLGLVFAFSNTTPQPVSELHFQLAVTKVTITPSDPAFLDLKS